MLTADNGRRAIDVTQAEHPDLIVLDPDLPDVGGVALIRQLRQVAPVPIIILSTRPEDADHREDADLGVVEYVLKPFRME
jgi:DNA-binding response OmpR family regulator